MWEWERLKARQSGRGESAEDVLAALGVPGLRLSEVEDALDGAVFAAHVDGDPEIPAEKIRRILQQEVFVKLHGLSSDKAIGCAEKFIVEWLRGRNGLLVPAAEDTFAVPHRSFREFMAARFLREHRLVNPDTDYEESWTASGPRLAKANLDRWREVFRFTAALDSPPEAAQALNELCPDQLTHDPVEVQRLFLAAEVARDVGPRTLSARSKLGKQVYDRVENQLLHLMRDTDPASGDYPNDKPLLTSPAVLPPKSRLAAGELLDALNWTPPDLYDFAPIYNTDARNLTDSDPLNSTNPLFFIAKYPVTNLQYQRFLESDDYADPDLWKAAQLFDADGKLRALDDEDLKWIQQNVNKELKPRLWDDPRFGASRRLFPVVGVNWYEAAAYCVWLTRHWAEELQTSNPSASLRTSLKLQNSKFQFRLPLEHEWAAAAGGEERERYPWQKTPAKVKEDEIVLYANTKSDLNGTTPVCMYPAGMSLAKIMDMSGNVWEWQANLYKKGEIWRALRGGAWYSEADRVTASARLDYHPVYWLIVNGFRVWAAASVSRS